MVGILLSHKGSLDTSRFYNQQFGLVEYLA
jgi:hypothetical protein